MADEETPPDGSVDTELEEAEEHLRELKDGDDNLSEFTEEFENMLRLLKKANENTARLDKKKQSLESAINTKREKAISTAKGMEEIKNRQERLRADITRFDNEVAKIKVKEEQTSGEIATVEAEVQTLQNLLDIGPGLTDEQNKMMKSLEERKETLTRECDARTNQLTNLRVGTKQLSDTLMEVEQARVASQLKITQIREAITQTKADTEQAQRRKDKLDKQLKTLSNEVEELDIQIAKRNIRITEGATNIETEEKKLRKIRASISDYVKANDDLHLKMVGLQKEYDERLHANDVIANSNKAQEKELRSRGDEIEQVFIFALHHLWTCMCLRED